MNNYDNAEPKPLKFLVSDGKLVDESGNVIAESDSLQDLYIKSSPQVKKYLLSDGSVVDENNNLIIKNDYYKKVYDQATPKVAKYLHSDGTIDENPGGGSGADLEDNHQTTIDVSTYTEPVEIEPIAGKDGMKKVTVTLDNVPSGNPVLREWSTMAPNAEAYGMQIAFTVSENPQINDNAYSFYTNQDDNEYFSPFKITEIGTEEVTYTDWKEPYEEITATLPYIVVSKLGSSIKYYNFGFTLRFE